METMKGGEKLDENFSFDELIARQINTTDNDKIAYVHALETAIISLSRNPAATNKLIYLLIEAVGDANDYATLKGSDSD